MNHHSNVVWSDFILSEFWNCSVSHPMMLLLFVFVMCVYALLSFSSLMCLFGLILTDRASLRTFTLRVECQVVIAQMSDIFPVLSPDGGLLEVHAEWPSVAYTSLKYSVYSFLFDSDIYQKTFTSQLYWYNSWQNCYKIVEIKCQNIYKADTHSCLKLHSFEMSGQTCIADVISELLAELYEYV